MTALSEMLVLTGRSMKHILRSPDTIITVCIMPIAMMLMFVYIFGGAIKSALPAGTNYVTYQLPGILLITVASGVAYTALRVFTDRQKGIFSRLHTMPISRGAALWAHVITSIVSNLVSVLVVIAVALLIGFRSSAGPLAWLGIIGMVLLFTLAMTWLAVIPGLTAKSAETAGAFSYPLIFLPFLSSAFAPTDTMPWAVRVFAEYQPVTPIVNSIRALLTNQPVGSNLWVALAWLIGISIVTFCIAVRLYRKAV
ncbi:MAG: ABC transporter permease [Propionibacteriaceae bacterium]|jgi:ABC-2 type transport system permease protein|nr:ABC transporter permease [Propionibacteriaceae bacterium]